MNPTLSALDVLAETLGWPRLEEGFGNAVVRNGPAEALLGRSGEPGANGDCLWRQASILSGVDETQLARWRERSPFAERSVSGAVVVGLQKNKRWTVYIDRERQSLMRRAQATDLAASVSHEVASSVAAIGGWAQLLRTGQAELSSEEVLRLISETASATHRTARDLLGQAGDESDTGKESVDLARLAHDIGRLLKLQARQRRVRIEVEAPRPLLAPMSRAKAFRILWNLSLNAVQHARRHVLIRAISATDSAQGRLEVHDDGSGLPEEHRRHVFEPYFTTRTHGTGLGLALVRRTAERAGGATFVGNSYLGGACFGAELPLSKAPAKRSPRMSRQKLRSGVRERPAMPRRVLIVEDDPGLRELLRTVLSLHEVEVDVACSVAEAKAAAEAAPRLHYDVALVDMTLDDGDGSAVLATLDERNVAHTLFVMSGSDPGDTLGPAAGWLRKPFDADELLSLLRRDAAKRANPTLSEAGL